MLWEEQNLDGSGGIILNQRINGVQFPLDNVSGYSLIQIENMVMNNATFTGFKDDMKRVYDNPTEEFLDQLRNNW